MRRSLLFIAYYFPPSVDAGAKRALGLARHLPEHGWDVTVVTPEVGRYLRADGEATPDEIGLPPTSVVRVGGGSGPDRSAAAHPSRVPERLKRLGREVLHIPDGYAHFYRPAVRAAEDLLARRPFDAILTSSSPYTSLRIGARLSQYRPWVADLRDLWLDNHFGYPHSRLRRWIDARLERRWLSRASAITTVTEGFRVTVSGRRYADVPVVTVPNGYLALDMSGEPPPRPQIRFTFTGRLYDNAAHPLFAALTRLRDRRPDLFACLEARFYGTVSNEFTRERLGLGLEAQVRFERAVPLSTAVRAQLESDIVLLLLPERAELEVVICSKAFDYLAAGRPILAIGPTRGESVDILRRAGHDAIFGAADVEAITALLIRWAEEKASTGRVAPPPQASVVESFSYRQRAAEMAAVLDRLGLGQTP